jgi:hypothetical protein
LVGCIELLVAAQGWGAGAFLGCVGCGVQGPIERFFRFLSQITGHYLGVLLVFFWSPVTGSKEQRSAKRRPAPGAPRPARRPPSRRGAPAFSLVLVGLQSRSSAKILLQHPACDGALHVTCITWHTHGRNDCTGGVSKLDRQRHRPSWAYLCSSSFCFFIFYRRPLSGRFIGF